MRFLPRFLSKRSRHERLTLAVISVTLFVFFLDTIDAWQQYGQDLQGIQSDLSNGVIDQFTARQRNNAAHATLDAAIAASTGLQRVAYQNAIKAALKALWAVAGAALSAALKDIRVTRTSTKMSAASNEPKRKWDRK